MNGMDGFAPTDIDPGDPAADAADEFIVEAVGHSGDGFHGDLLISVPAYQGHPVIDLGFGNVGHIHHQLVHADAAQNGCPLAVDQYVEFTGKISAVAVGVAHGNGGDSGVPGAR